MTRPKHTEKIIYFNCKSGTLFKKSLITIYDILNLSIGDLNLNEFEKSRQFLKSKHQLFSLNLQDR